MKPKTYAVAKDAYRRAHEIAILWAGYKETETGKERERRDSDCHVKMDNVKLILNKTEQGSSSERELTTAEQ